MTLSLPEKKIGQIKDQCLRLYNASEVSLLDLTKLIGTLSSTIQTVLPSCLQFRVLKQQQIISLKQPQTDFTLVKLTPMAKNQLFWWVNNLEHCYGRLVMQPQALVLIQTDPSKKRIGDCMSRDQNRESVVQEGTGSTYQSAGTFAHKVCHLDICQNWKMSAIHIRVDNMAALSYLLKMGGTKNPELMQISKEIWEFILEQRITITDEHLPGNLNCKADWDLGTRKLRQIGNCAL